MRNKNAQNVQNASLAPGKVS
ncbi:MAG: hypothetical protein QG584_2372, partial [Pseudomonadota bacterium]|nr:hypothetical protein [Pseudomonadota bacterium]